MTFRRESSGNVTGADAASGSNNPGETITVKSGDGDGTGLSGDLIFRMGTKGASATSEGIYKWVDEDGVTRAEYDIGPGNFKLIRLGSVDAGGFDEGTTSFKVFGSDGATDGDDGQGVLIQGGAGTGPSAANGGSIVLQIGARTVGGTDGTIQINHSDGTQKGSVSPVDALLTINTLDGAGSGDNGINLTLSTGDGNATGTTNGGNLTLETGIGKNGGTDGKIILSTGTVEPTAAAAAVEFAIVLPILTGASNGQDLRLKAGGGGPTDGDGGDLVLVKGDEQGSGVPGAVTAQGQIYSAIQATKTPTGGTETIDWGDGNFAVIDLTSSGATVVLTLNNPRGGAIYFVKFIGASSTRVVTWPASVLWPGGTAPTITTAGVDLVRLAYDGTDYLGTFDNNFT